MQILLIFSLIIAFLVVLVALQNVDPVTIRFLVWETRGTLAMVLIITLLAGALLSYLTTLPAQVRRRLLISQQQNQIAELQGKLSEYERHIEEENNQVEKSA